MAVRINLPLDRLIDFSRKHPIQKLWLFGSVLREDFNEASDVDVLVQFAPSSKVDLFDMAMMESELSRIVGRQVDLRTPNELSRYFRQDVLDSAYLVYER